MPDKITYTVTEFMDDIQPMVNWISEHKFRYVYGVPRGGIPLAQQIFNDHESIIFVTSEHALRQLESTDRVIVVDDVVDSGRTRERYKAYPFACLHLKKCFKPSGPESVVDFAVHKDVEDWIVYWWEGTEEKSIEDAVVRTLQYIGEDPTREGLLQTPQRVARTYQELFSGYQEDPASLFTTFEEKYDEMVVLKDIEFYSTCEHHMLPFIGKAHIAYIPNGKVIGISKLARLLEVYARRLQIQERICEQVTTDLVKYLEPQGAGCIIEARHLCMCARGVGKQNCTMVTSSLKGAFIEKPEARAELMRLIG